MNLATVPPHGAFLDAIAADWLARAGGDPLAAADGLILLPTRRAARALADSFLHLTEGRPMLLPRIAAVGAPDEAPLALAGALDLPPAIPAVERQVQLTRLVLAMNGRFGVPGTADHAWPLAAELAALMDEAERAEVDLAAVLPTLAAERYASHWGITLEFLRIVTTAWPAFLAETGQMNPAARQVALLGAQAEAWEKSPPPFPVLAAGSTGGIPAVARLLRVVAGLARGRVVLPGLDLAMGEAAWAAMDDTHPQAALGALLAGMQASRGDVRPMAAPEGAPAARTALLGRALLPAACLGAWREPLPAAADGLWRLSPADQQEEAVAIALLLRGALERPGHRAALVTPDRDLAARVAVELGRFGIVADDSAGEALAHTPPAVFLRLLAEAVAEGLRPVPLLALLKHPLAAAGLSPAECRELARRLEREGLRGAAPAPGLAGLRAAARSEEARAFVETAATALAAVLELPAETSPAPALAALLRAAEALAATREVPGGQALWCGEEGQALAALLGELLPALEALPKQPTDTLPGLLDAALAGATLRSRRALRGRSGAEHPRIFIWGLLEARLQRADLVVLGGLAEGVWPGAADPGPWMSRPMRAEAKLPSPEAAVGLAAHDWMMAACAAPEVVLSCPLRRDGAPAVPARWLQRLEAMLRGGGQALPDHPAATWARALDQPAAPPPRRAPPAPRPAVAHRPRVLRVTEVETWLRDPYAIYARRVLRLEALRPIEESADAADYGIIVHAAIHDFLRQIGTDYPPDAAERLAAAMDAALHARQLRPALAAWWRPRLHRIAAWAAEQEASRRLGAGIAHLASEVEGRWDVPGTAGFALRGRADRIEMRHDGSIAILDYKTGAPPSAKQVAAGLAPQLPLEAAMAEDGAFGPDIAARVGELTYWKLSGGHLPGKVQTLYKKKDADIGAEIALAREKLAALVARFDDPSHPYLSQPHPGQAPRFSDYTQLARVGEWAALDEEDEG